ncbi:MAG: LuxR C-terminal-related transcriptional regulator [Alphaproteobacteria bacterium]|nr:LuxR C-terminal-related transcriptional regulator [Alphaproteobacteria bacterium]
MNHSAAYHAYADSSPATDPAARRAMALGALFGAASHAGVPLTRALAALRQESRADVVCLLRVTGTVAARLIATTAAQPSLIDPRIAAFARRLCTDPAQLIAGHTLMDARTNGQCAVVLGVGTHHADLLILRNADPIVLSDFGAIATPIWAGRRPGLARKAIAALATGPQDDTPVAPDAILSEANPAGLTPAERRIAMALRDGLSPAQIGTMLQIAMPTVRTHLRNIYNKTGLRGMHEVCHRLHTEAARHSVPRVDGFACDAR